MSSAEEEFTPEERERIRANIEARGMTFEVFLPESLADWLRAKIAADFYADAAEAALVAFQELHELDRHPRVRTALLDARIQAALDDPRPGISVEEFRTQLQAKWREFAHTEPPATDRRYRTGRNQQINIKATAQVIERLYKLADARHVPLGELLEQALDALERPPA